MRAAECSGKLRIETAFILLVAACLSGCGGGSVAAPPPPAITVTVVGPSAVLNPGSYSHSQLPYTTPRTARSLGRSSKREVVPSLPLGCTRRRPLPEPTR